MPFRYSSIMLTLQTFKYQISRYKNYYYELQVLRRTFANIKRTKKKQIRSENVLTVPNIALKYSSIYSLCRSFNLKCTFSQKSCRFLKQNCAFTICKNKTVLSSPSLLFVVGKSCVLGSVSLEDRPSCQELRTAPHKVSLHGILHRYPFPSRDRQG